VAPLLALSDHSTLQGLHEDGSVVWGAGDSGNRIRSTVPSAGVPTRAAMAENSPGTGTSGEQKKAPRARASWRTLGIVGAAGLLTFLLSAVLTTVVVGSDRPDPTELDPPSPEQAAPVAAPPGEPAPRASAPRAAQAPKPAEPPAKRAQTGNVLVQAPRGIAPAELRVSLLRFGEVARAADGRPVSNLAPAQLRAVHLEPGIYVARVNYRDLSLPELVADVTAGEPSPLAITTTALAEAEYAAGLRASEKGGTADIPYFRRAVRLNPGHLDAHLQLAAFELVNGSRRSVQGHLTAVRRIDPDNPDAARVERLLRGRKR